MIVSLLPGLDAMAKGYVVPAFSADDVRSAGEILRRLNPSQVTLIGIDQESWARNILDNWKAAHAFPLNTLHMALKSYARQVTGNPNALTVSRIKRVNSILGKLWGNHQVDLVNMQDIGGCRAIVDSIAQVMEIRRRHIEGHARHKLRKKNGENNYIEKPNKRGYRSLHLIYEYEGSKSYTGMPIEIQIRTKVQHMWATANEVAGTMRGEKFKNGHGDPQWLRMFALLGSAFAIYEGTATAPGTPETLEGMKAEVLELNQVLQFESSLRGYATGVETIEKANIPKGAHLFLLELDPIARELYVTAFMERQQMEALDALANAERAAVGTPKDIVLVSADHIRGLKRAYPNYSLDTGLFLSRVEKVLGLSVNL